MLAAVCGIACGLLCGWIATPRRKPTLIMAEQRKDKDPADLFLAKIAKGELANLSWSEFRGYLPSEFILSQDKNAWFRDK